MKVLKKEDIIDVLYGATLLGGGGGGSLHNGIDMLEKYIETHPGKPVSLEMIEPSEMKDGVYSAVTAGMGAPTAIKETDFSIYATNTFDLLKDMAGKFYDPPRVLGYSMAVEMGGFNTFVPMLISLDQGYPFINTEGAARAVPALSTLLFGMNGYDTSPLAMADGFTDTKEHDKVIIQLKDPKNSAVAEKLGRDVTIELGYQMAGLCGWMLKKEDFDAERLPIGSIEIARRIGKILRNSPAQDVFKNIAAEGIVECKGVSGYTVVAGESGSGAGFDNGFILFKNDGGDHYYRFDFQNENLVVLGGKNAKALSPIMTAPDIICAFKVDGGGGNLPVTNADFFDPDTGKVLVGTKVCIGLIPVDKVWWHTGYENVNTVWKEFFGNVGYEGDIIKYEDVSDADIIA
ncbi:MAG: DUF917 domain-containing protein [Clostridiales Family XIII bacterium]|jgi:DUF917 family protein|nr:DUF917 domain-containing protein [Clostridiales Family XIII bacterium]